MIHGTERRAKILIGKAGLNGHDRGVRAVEKALQDAGFEVVYSGLHQSPEDFVNRAIEEGVDVIGISILTGAHLIIFSRVMELLREKGTGDIPVFGGGIIPEEDIERLKEIGVKEVFLPGTPLERVTEFVKDIVRNKNI